MKGLTMIDKALPAGLAGEKLSRAITGTDEVSSQRSAVAAGAGAGMGYLAASGTVIGLEVVGLTAAATAAAPAVGAVMVVAGGIALIRSLFD
ncbi:hypothetical protein [Pseudoduganella sp. OTU4001]|uniref:hypothetical protein n=1 Tax=Pseudoduganella sp. OTU4001 TaxID=3043854 RepID=UPI00313EF0CC